MYQRLDLPPQGPSIDTDCNDFLKGCENRTCRYKPKKCSTKNGRICSGNGNCSYVEIDDPTTVVFDCRLDDQSCIPKCNCINSYGGELCDKTEDDLLAARNHRKAVLENFQVFWQSKGMLG